MIYELAVVARPESGDDVLASLKTIVSEAITSMQGEVLLTDDWGLLHFAQPTSKGVGKGKYLYFAYKTENMGTNKEISRRFKINENVLKSIIIKVGENNLTEATVKNYKSPFSKIVFISPWCSCILA